MTTTTTPAMTPEMMIAMQQMLQNTMAAQTTQSLDNCRTTKEVVEFFFDEKGYTASLASIKQGRRTKSVQDIRNEFAMFCQERSVKRELRGNQNFDAGLGMIQNAWYEDELTRLDTVLNEEPEDDDAWSDLLFQSGWKEDDAIVIKGWIHNIKNIIRGEKPLQIPMPVLYASDQGVGKSFFSRELLKPLGSLARMQDVKQLNDSFGKILFSKLLVADFDEMAGFDKSDVNTFKAWATQDMSLTRLMQSQNFVESPKITQGIGSSNKPIRSIINDTTGSRRLWEITCGNSLVDMCRSLDFEALWQSVDLDQPNPYELNRARLEKVAFDEQRNTSDVEDFIADFVLTEMYTKSMPAKTLYENYVRWNADSGNQYTKSTKAFGLALTEGDLKTLITKKRSNAGNVYAFDEDTAVFKSLKDIAE